MNNARLLNFKLYEQDLSDFEKLFNKEGRDFHRLIAFCKTLEKQKEPEKYLHSFVQ